MTILPLLGLSLITIGWLVQFYKINSKKEKGFDFKFLVLYAVGAFAVSYAGFANADVISGGLNLVVGIIALVIGYYTK